MKETTLQECQQLIGYQFNNVDLLATALTHSSVAVARSENNERLEFLGDAVLGLSICEGLYLAHDDLTEGVMTRIKSAVVSRQTCAVIAREIGICGLLSLGKGMVGPEGLPQSVAAAVFESVIGAIYLDGGMEPARDFILKHMRPQIEEALMTEHQSNYKSMLQQHSQRQWAVTPEYRLLDEKGPDHDKCFEITAEINGRHFPSAWGKTKKEAEQKAARLALEALELLDREQ